MNRTPFIRLISLLLCLCLLPATALGYGETPVYKDPVTHSDIELNFKVFPEAFPESADADLLGWQEFLQKLSFRGGLDAQNPLTDKVRGWFDGGLYINDRLIVPFQVDVYMTFRYLQSRIFRGENMFFKMENFFEFMMKPRYFMDLPTDYIALLMYPEAALEMRDRFYTPLAELCQGEGDRVVAYDDLYDLVLTWEDMYMNDGEHDNELFFFLTCLLYNIGINYDVYEQLGMMTDWLDVLDPEGAGMIITRNGNTETYTIGDRVVFTRDVNATRTFTLSLPNANGDMLTLTSKEVLGENWDADNWYLALNITLAPEEGEEAETFLNMKLDMEGIPLRDLYQTSGNISFHAEGAALEEPIAESFYFTTSRSDIKCPNISYYNLFYRHPETQMNCFNIELILRNSEVPYTVLQEHVYPFHEDFFHLNDEYLQRIKESYIPSLALNFLPVIAEMPAGVINDILRFAEETDILVSLGIE